MTVTNLQNKCLKLHKSSRGFTLIELLVALSIAAAIIGVMTMSIIIMMRSAPRFNAQSIALTQVQNAGIFISRDAMIVNSVTTRATNDFLSMYWTDLEGNIHTINYIIENAVLKRQTSPEGEEIQVAEYIEPPPSTSANFTAGDSFTKSKLDVTIKSSFGGSEVERSYTITPRLM